MRVPIVEDERRLAENIAHSLRESAGYAVDVALDGEEGLYLAQSNPYDLVLLDLMLPKIDGLTLLKRLRGGSGDVPVPVRPKALIRRGDGHSGAVLRLSVIEPYSSRGEGMRMEVSLPI